jgi:hypothetical protein
LLNEARIAQRVAGDDVEVFDTVEDEVHAGDGCGDVDQFLAIKAECAHIAAAALHLGQ